MADPVAPGSTILIAAQSGRAIAAAARRAGYVPLVADLFADADTRDLAEAAVAVEGALGTGFRARALVAALDRLAAGASTPPAGLLLGSGFEDRPGLIARLAARWRLFGTPAAGVAAAKDPFALADACREAGIPYPDVRADVPPTGDWLVKRIGASGGGHVRAATRPGPVRPDRYAQARVPGDPISLGFVADGRDAVPVGFCRQWLDPHGRAAYRLGGVAGPVDLPQPVRDGLAASARALTRRFGLVGLAGIDAVLAPDGSWHLVEVNPRPGLALDVLDCGDVPLVTAVIAACTGQRIELQPLSGQVRAVAVVYSETAIAAVLAADWPDYVFDRPAPGAAIGMGRPIATVRAEGETFDDARRQAMSRAAAVREAAGDRRGG